MKDVIDEEDRHVIQVNEKALARLHEYIRCLKRRVNERKLREAAARKL